MWGQMMNAGMGAANMMGRRAGQAPTTRPGMPMGQPQKMAIDTSGSQGGAGMGINMMNAQKNPWETQQRNFGMIGPQQGYGQRYRGLGPSEEAMDSMQTQYANWNQGKQIPRMGIRDNFRSQVPMNMQQPVGQPSMGDDGVMQREQLMGIGPRSPYENMIGAGRMR